MPKHPLGPFKGLNDVGRGYSSEWTRFLENVNIRNGRILGRLGIDELNNITGVSATTPILALCPYYTKDLTTQLLRITQTKCFELTNAADGTWVDVTGSDLSGANTDLIQFINHDELLIFTNGKDKPRKWTGSGNNTADLGGTPPYGKAIMQMVGFVMLGNVSDDGTFTDVTLGHLKVRYTEDYDGDWSPCIGHELVLDETNGQIEAGVVHGIYGVWAKADAVITTRFLGSGRGFFQSQLRFGGRSKGVIAPNSFKDTKAGIIFLGSDYELYITDGQSIKPLPPNVQTKLQSDMQIDKARQVFAEVIDEKETYDLFIPIDSDTWSAARLRYNYRTGEVSYNEYASHEFISAASFRYTNSLREILVASTNDLVWELDTTDKDDNGTAVVRFWRSDWQTFGVAESKTFKAAYLHFNKVLGCRVKIEVAVDRSERFLFAKSFDLRGDAGETDTIIEYKPGDDLSGTEFDLKITMYHYSTTQAEFVGGFIDWEKEPSPIELREHPGAALG